MGIAERVAYLRGLAEGLGLTADEKQGPFTNELLSVVESLATEIDRIKKEQVDLDDYLNEVDDAIADLEDEVYGYCDCDEELDPEVADYFFGDHALDQYRELECPHCGETVAYFEDPAFLKGADELICPHCDEVVKTFDAEDADELVLESDEEELD